MYQSNSDRGKKKTKSRSFLFGVLGKLLGGGIANILGISGKIIKKDRKLHMKKNRGVENGSLRKSSRPKNAIGDTENSTEKSRKTLPKIKTTKHKETTGKLGKRKEILYLM